MKEQDQDILDLRQSSAESSSRKINEIQSDLQQARASVKILQKELEVEQGRREKMRQLSEDSLADAENKQAQLARQLREQTRLLDSKTREHETACEELRTLKLELENKTSAAQQDTTSHSQSLMNMENALEHAQKESSKLLEELRRMENQLVVKEGQIKKVSTKHNSHLF